MCLHGAVEHFSVNADLVYEDVPQSTAAASCDDVRCRADKHVLVLLMPSRYLSDAHPLAPQSGWVPSAIPSIWRSPTARRPMGGPRRNRRPTSASSAHGWPCGCTPGGRPGWHDYPETSQPGEGSSLHLGGHSLVVTVTRPLPRHRIANYLWLVKRGELLQPSLDHLQPKML